VIVSGRYDLLETGRLPAFVQYSPVTHKHELGPFQNYEAENYLRDKRRLNREDMVAAIAFEL
jgi:hypothetical protein